MDAHNEARRLCRWVAATALSVLVSSHARAAPMKIEAVMTPKADSRLEFADGSKRFLVAYLKYRFRAVPVPDADGKLRFVAHGVWESAGGSGRFKGMRGIGNVVFNPSDRRWTLEGDLAAVQ